MRLYLEASALIYLIEGVTPFRDTAVARVTQVEASENGLLITSRLSRLECRVKPLREGDHEMVARYDVLFTRRLMRVAELSAPVVERGTESRARLGLKTPDTRHVATAIEERADVILTGDAALARVTDLRVEILRP